MREARDELELTQAAFAAAVGSGARTVQTWEAGEWIPRPQTLQRIAEVTGHPVSWFYEEPAAVAGPVA